MKPIITAIDNVVIIFLGFIVLLMLPANCILALIQIPLDSSKKKIFIKMIAHLSYSTTLFISYLREVVNDKMLRRLVEKNIKI